MATPIKSRRTGKSDAVQMSPVEREKHKEMLMQKLLMRDPSVVLAKPDKSSKSYAWITNCFLLIYNNNVKQNYVFCTVCSNLITYNSVNGTGSLLRHNCHRKTLEASSGHNFPLEDTPTSSKRGSLSTSMAVKTILTPKSEALNDSSQFRALDITKIKKEIEEQIGMGDTSIEMKAPLNIKSEIWRNGNFKIIYKDGKKLDFVMCLYCNSLITYRSKTGTASLLRHKCMKDIVAKKNAAAAQHAETKFQDLTQDEDCEIEETSISGSQYLEQYLPTEFPEEFKEEAAKLLHCAMYEDMLPANASHRKGFLNFAQYLINVGAEYGKVNITNVLECRDNVQLADNFVGILQNMIKTKFEEHKITLSCDVWVDANRKLNMFTLYGHFIDDVFQLKKINLGTVHFALVDHISEVDYKAFIFSILESYFPGDTEMQQFLSKTTIVVSCDMASQFKQYSTINCSCYNLNIIVHNLLNDPNLKEILPIEMVNLDNWANIWDHLDQLESAKSPGVEQMLSILNPFKLASKSLGSDQKPTINEVYIFKKKLEDHFKNVKYEEKIIGVNALQLIEASFPVTNLHKIAIFLDPRFKSLKFMSAEEKLSVINMTSKMISMGESSMDSVVYESESKPVIHRLATSSSTTAATPIDCSDSTKYLIEYMDITEERIEDIHEEVRTYLDLKFNDIYSANILEFWESRYDLPRLRQLSKTILCIPASAIVSEKIFCDEATQFSKRRLNMEISSLTEMLFIHENYYMIANLI